MAVLEIEPDTIICYIIATSLRSTIIILIISDEIYVTKCNIKKASRK